MQNEQNTTTNITMKLYKSPAANFEGHEYECVCCGRKLKENHNQYIHLNKAWVAVHPSVDEDDFQEFTGYESQGWWFIGNECAKQMKGFTFKYND